MATHATHVTAAFVCRLAAVFVGLHAFVALLLVLGVFATAPHLAVGDVVTALPDLLLLSVPVTLPVCCLAATVLTLDHARRHGVFLTYRLTGADPRRAFLPALGICALLGAGSWWTASYALPGAARCVAARTVALADDPRSVAMFLATHPRGLGRITADFDGIDDEGLTGFRARVRDAGVVAARRARLHAGEPADDRVTLALDRGRWLQTDDEGGLRHNLRFDGLALHLDGREFRGPSLRSIPDLRYVREDELDRLLDQQRYLTRRGIRPSRTQRKRVARRATLRLARVQGGLLVPLFAALAIGLLGAGRDPPRRRTVAIVVACCVVVLLPQHLLLQAAARDGEIKTSLLALLPTLEVGVAAGALLVWNRFTRGRAA